MSCNIVCSGESLSEPCQALYRVYTISSIPTPTPATLQIHYSPSPASVFMPTPKDVPVQTPTKMDWSLFNDIVWISFISIIIFSIYISCFTFNNERYREERAPTYYPPVIEKKEEKKEPGFLDGFEWEQRQLKSVVLYKLIEKVRGW